MGLEDSAVCRLMDGLHIAAVSPGQGMACSMEVLLTWLGDPLEEAAVEMKCKGQWAEASVEGTESWVQPLAPYKLGMFVHTCHCPHLGGAGGWGLRLSAAP